MPSTNGPLGRRMRNASSPPSPPTMGDVGDFWKDVKGARAEARAARGVPCPECQSKLPKARPSILLPQQVCRIHGYRDPRPRDTPPQEPKA